MRVADKNSLVTIAMPVFNGGDYFRQSLSSALNQSHENIEIVVVNDGSSDGGETERIALNFASEKIQYFRQDNTGVGGALNRAIENAKGDFFCWLSHDDLFVPEKTSAQICYHSALQRPDGIIFSDYDLIDPSGNTLAEVRFDQARLRKTPMLALLNGYINGCTLFVPMPLMRKYGPFDQALRYTQDYDLWNKMLHSHEFFHQNKSLVRCRQHPGQDTHKPNAIVEGDLLWQNIMESRSPLEKVQLFGSERRFYWSMANFLDNTPYKQAALHARQMSGRDRMEILVSVVIPFFNEIGLVVRAVKSVLDQTHQNFEVILVNDGSTESLKELDALVQQEPRLTLVHQVNSGPGAARNFGMSISRGDYIAFLDADDLFLPNKIELQLEMMIEEGFLISHTSYNVVFPERFPLERLGLINSGQQRGRIYPDIIAGCSIATPTVMMHRSIMLMGFRFPTGTALGEDVLFWVDLALHFEIGGLDSPLSIVEWSSSSAALNLEKAVEGVGFIYHAVSAHPIHSKEAVFVDRLRALEIELSQMKIEYATDGKRPFLHESLISYVFGPTPSSNEIEYQDSIN